MSDAITLARSGTARSWAAAALSLALGLAGVLSFVAGRSVVLLILGIVLIGLGALLAAASAAPRDRLVVDADAVSRTVNRRQQWRLRWAHMAAVHFVADGLWLVPLPEVAEHPEIAPALEPRDVNGVRTPTFAVTLPTAAQPAVRAAVTRHAPPQLLVQSSPRPPST